MLDKFLDDTDNSALKPVPTNVPDILTSQPGAGAAAGASNPAPKNKPVAN